VFTHVSSECDDESVDEEGLYDINMFSLSIWLISTANLLRHLGIQEYTCIGTSGSVWMATVRRFGTN
jgi:hypothetical protein